MTRSTAIPSVKQPAVDRHGRWTNIWYRWIKPLLDDVKDAATAAANAQTLADANVVQITQTNTVVDGIKAEWGVAITGTAGNEQVVGLVRLDGGLTGSTFTVVADKFIVAHPTASGTTIQAFIIGLVDGVSTVGINGDLIIDGSILARHIQTNTLSAIAADIGTVTAGVIQSTDGRMVIDLDNGSITASTV